MWPLRAPLSQDTNNIVPDLIKFTLNTSSINQGKFTPGMHIPFKSKSVFVQNPTQTGLLFAWNHKAEIMEKNKEKKKTFTSAGGKWPKHIEKD